MSANRIKGYLTSDRFKMLLCVILGTLISFGLACFLHFAYELSGKSLVAAVFASVNESVWEHVKILCIPYLLWSIGVYYILRPDFRRLLVARTAGVISIMVLTICFFFIYSGVWGSHVLWIDIVSCVLWLAAGELISMRVLNTSLNVRDLFPIAAAMLCLVVVMLLCFTVSPPRIGLFRDPNTLLYGLEIRP